MTKLFNKVEIFTKSYFISHGFKRQIKHLERTVYWVKKLNPEADDALLIAAMAHDIGNAYRWKELSGGFRRSFTNKGLLERHQREGAEIIETFLKKESADEKLIRRVKNLISKHEEGGSKDQNTLKDADSISFFENNINHFLKDVDRNGKEKTKQKFDWMYKRITSKEAKRISVKWYRNAIDDLEKI